MFIRKKIYSTIKKKNYTSFYFPFLLILTFVLILFSKTDYLLVNKVKSVSIDYITPITKFISSPADLLTNLSLRINDIKNLETENLKLKQEIIRLKKWQILAIKNSRENRVFKKLLNSTSHKVEIIKTASVISQSQSFFSKLITINAGLENNVSEDMAVINEKGLIGKTVFASNENSRILMINDSSSSIPVKTLSDNSYSILRGTNEGKYLISSFIKDTELPKIGDLLVTSGNAKIFPRDILVAKVIEVNEDHYFALPYVDFKNLNYVQVVKSK
jgi:rod shape-determining protein MreC